MFFVLCFLLGSAGGAHATQAPPVVLTEAERAYLAQRGPVRLVVDPDWYPYEEIDERNAHRGIAAHLMALVAQRTGIHFELVPTATWEDSLRIARSGQADVLSFLNKTEARSQWLLFTEPYYIDPNVLITREEHDYITNLARLTGETVVLPEGTSVEERLRQDYPNLKIIIVKSEAEALAYVASKKAHMTLRSLTMGAYVIKNKGYFNLKIAGEVPRYENRLRMGITKGDGVLQGILNKGIASLTEQEVQDAINHHISMHIVKGFDYKLFGIVFGVFSVVLLSSLFWTNRIQRLNKTLKHQRDELVLLSDKLKESTALHTSILNASPDAILLSDAEGTVLLASPATRRILELPEKASQEGLTLQDFIVEEEHEKLFSNVQRLMRGERLGKTHYHGVTSQGKAVVFEMSSEIVQDEEESKKKFVSVVRDVTEEIATEEALRNSEAQYRIIANELESKNILLQEAASVDVLTGLQNRYSFNHRIAEEIERAKRYGTKVSLILIDIDKFKRINDTYGHDAGDAVIRSIAATLKKMLRQVDLIARWGGEEFVVLMPETGLHDALAVGEKLRQGVAARRHLENETITISAGVSTWTTLDAVETWFQRTDRALYHAKQGGRNRICASEGPETTILELLTWDPSWISGHAIIDEQHQALLATCEKLVAALLHEKLPLPMEGPFRDFVRDIQKHFVFEEGLLHEKNYGDLEAHRACHRQLWHASEKLVELSAQGRALPEDVVRFIADDVVRGHLLHEDRKFFPLLRGEA